MQIIPLVDAYSQTLSTTLGGQSCRVNVYQKATGLFLDLYVADALIIGGVICQNGNPIVRDAYLNFVGELMFIDNQGSSDPTTPGLGTRYSLVYLEASDLGGIG